MSSATSPSPETTTGPAAGAAPRRGAGSPGAGAGAGARGRAPLPVVPETEGVAGVVVALTLLVAAVVLVAGIVGLVDPASFRDTLDLAASDGFTRLAGALQLGLGTALLLSLIWREALTATLAGAVVGGAAATLATATADGASGTAVAGFAIGTVAALVAWVARYRQLGLVLGDVGRGTSSPALAPFVRQKTIVLTSYKRDGTPVGTPVSVAVDGDRAYVRSFEKAFKSKRIANNPRVELSPATAKGKVLGPGIAGTARLLSGAEDERAAALIARKHPLLHGVMVPFGHKAGRKKTGATIHWEITPLDE